MLLCKVSVVKVGTHVNKIISIYIIYSLHQNAVIYRIHNTLSSYCIGFSELTEQALALEE